MLLFQGESKWETILMKRTLICMKMHETACRIHFHMKGFALCCLFCFVLLFVVVVSFNTSKGIKRIIDKMLL